MQLYLTQAPAALEAMRAAVAGGDAATLNEAAHSFKSSSANVGAIRLAEFCRQLEALGRANTMGDAARLLAALESEYEAVRLAILALLPGGTATPD